MSKGLEALNDLLNGYDKTEDVIYFVDKDNLDIIEKELKALEIIRRLPEDYLQILLSFIRDEWFKNEDFGAFISWGGDETPILINEKEYDLLKEVLS